MGGGRGQPRKAEQADNRKPSTKGFLLSLVKINSRWKAQIFLFQPFATRPTLQQPQLKIRSIKQKSTQWPRGAIGDAVNMETRLN